MKLASKVPGRQASRCKNGPSDNRIRRHVYLEGIDLTFRSSLFKVRYWRVSEQYKRMPIAHGKVFAFIIVYPLVSKITDQIHIPTGFNALKASSQA
jgi:hypothetical protein